MITGESIKTARIVKGWTQQQLADFMGINRHTVEKIENDPNCKSRKIANGILVFMSTNGEKDIQFKDFAFVSADEIFDIFKGMERIKTFLSLFENDITQKIIDDIETACQKLMDKINK